MTTRPPVGPPLEAAAVKVGAIEVDDQHARRGRSRPRWRRRSAPAPSDSPATCRTTRPLLQPIALRVPNSRVRRVTPEIVNRIAIRNAAASTISDSQVPRFAMSPAAEESEPETFAARSACVLTVASGSSVSSSDATVVDRVGARRLHVDRRDLTVHVGEALGGVERDVGVGCRRSRPRRWMRRCRSPRSPRRRSGSCRRPRAPRWSPTTGRARRRSCRHPTLRARGPRRARPR